jgi:hypothetical protein
MARYKDYDYSQGKFIPIHFDRQILPGTFEYSLHYLIDNEDEAQNRFDKRQTHLQQETQNDRACIGEYLLHNRVEPIYTLRGKRKVNTQWLLYCAVHDLFKVHRYGLELA